MTQQWVPEFSFCWMLEKPIGHRQKSPLWKACFLLSKDWLRKRHPSKTEIFFFFFFFLFFFFATPMDMEFLDQWLNLSFIGYLNCSCSHAGTFNPLCWPCDQTCILVLQRHHWSCCATAGTRRNLLTLNATSCKILKKTSLPVSVLW